MIKPKVSVVMSVYNGEAYLKEAIASILNQTFLDFEFLIINDCSTDSSLEIIHSFNDHRIKLINNERNIGLPGSLNIGIDRSQGAYIARMDADDISFPDRFAKQFNYMEKHPDVLVLGSRYRVIGSEIISKDIPLTYDQIKIFMLMQSPIAHPTAFIRRNVFDNYKLKYNESFLQAQDYELWSRVLEVGKIANLPDVLLHYRIHDQQITSSRGKKQLELAYPIRVGQLQKLVDFDVKKYSPEFAIKILSKERFEITQGVLNEIKKMLSDLYNENVTKKIYSDEFFVEYLRDVWITHLFRRTNFYTSDIPILLPDKYNKIFKMGFFFNVKFFLKSFKM